MMSTSLSLQKISAAGAFFAICINTLSQHETLTFGVVPTSHRSGGASRFAEGGEDCGVLLAIYEGSQGEEGLLH